MGEQFVLHIDATALALSKSADAAPQMNFMLSGFSLQRRSTARSA
ncbi:MAG: hypothetical protein ACT4NY_05990 [Pseudonocardiales bacterium]